MHKPQIRLLHSKSGIPANAAGSTSAVLHCILKKTQLTLSYHSFHYILLHNKISTGLGGAHCSFKPELWNLLDYSAKNYKYTDIYFLAIILITIYVT